MFISTLPRYLLILIGLWDLIRGILHLFLVEYAADKIAGAVPICSEENENADNSYYTVMMSYGASNLQIGFLNLFVACKYPQYSQYMLLLFSVMFSILIITSKIKKVDKNNADYPGRYVVIGAVILSAMVSLVSILGKGKK